MAFEELKERQGVMWGSAPFENYVHSLAEMHDDLVERLDPKPGERFLDVGTGTGEVAFRAAVAGAEVTGSDLAPGLIETASRALSNSLEPERRSELASTMAAFFEQYRDGDGIHQPRAYYVVLGTRR